MLLDAGNFSDCFHIRPWRRSFIHAIKTASTKHCVHVCVSSQSVYFGSCKRSVTKHKGAGEGECRSTSEVINKTPCLPVTALVSVHHSHTGWQQLSKHTHTPGLCFSLDPAQSQPAATGWLGPFGLTVKWWLVLALFELIQVNGGNNE